MDDNGSPRLPPGLDRRGFLRTTAGGGIALAIAAALPTPLWPALDAPAADLESLTAAEYATARAAADAMLRGIPVEPDLIARRLDHELHMVGGPIERDMKTVLKLMERLTILGGHVRPFSALDAADRLDYLAGWRDSRFALRRAAFNALRSFVYFFAYAEPATWPLTNFPGPWPGRFPIPARPIDFGPIA